MDLPLFSLSYWEPSLPKQGAQVLKKQSLELRFGEQLLWVCRP